MTQKLSAELFAKASVHFLFHRERLKLGAVRSTSDSSNLSDVKHPVGAKVRRSAYADRLAEFASFAFGDEAAFDQQGKWYAFFQNRIGSSFDRRIILEIGCFDAAYLCKIAAKHPTTAFIGIDWKCKAIYDGATRIDKMGLNNVALLRARGQDLSKLFALGELDAIWLFHPDPCDSVVELKNRLFAEPFLRDVHSVLKRESILALKTDHPGYFQWVLSLFGLPQPLGFDQDYVRTSMSPKLKSKELMNRADLPKANPAVVDLFQPPFRSENFWQDSTAIAHTIDRHFTGEETFFEQRFTKKRFPIYYFEVKVK